MAPTSFLDTIDPKGHLLITKTYTNGLSEVLLDEHNVITDGMGVTLAALFSNDDLTVSSGDFAIPYFQVGTAAQAMDTSTVVLGNPLSLINYGSPIDLTVGEHENSAGVVQAFVHLNNAYIARSSLSKITYTVLLTDDHANSQSINEIGLFSKNPLQANPSRSYLCAYRTFNTIEKNSDFSLTFRWTLEF
tara:strand:+ start:436 stop:1005 length:570 start_codon:yes stop_codon:yes gene_type:complete